METAQSSASQSGTGTGEVVRDNYIPLFDGRPSSYREWRKRITLYQKKMVLAKRAPEGVINLLTSFSGHVWKQVEHLAETATEQEDGFITILQTLDRIYQYDAKVEMPKAFEKFFFGVARGNSQTLLAYCAEHRDCARELEKYDVKLPPQVAGWLLLRRASLTQEQRQLVLSQVPQNALTPEKIEEVMYYLFGQDYRGKYSEGTFRHRAVPRSRTSTATTRWHRNWRSSSTAYVADDEPVDFDDYGEDAENDEVFYEEDDGEEYDVEQDEDAFYNLEDATEDQAYFNDDDVEEGYEEAYASYLDARRRFAEIRASRGYYPVVALVDGAPQPGRDQHPVPPSSKGKTQKGTAAKGKGAGGKPSGKGRGSIKGSTAKSRAAATKCLRCGQPGHWAAQCPKPPPTSSTTTTTMPPPQAKRPRGEGFVASGSNSLGPAAFNGQVVGIQDGGASSVVCGHELLMEILSAFLQKDVSPSEFLFSRCNKTFLFGGDTTSIADWCIHLPIWVGGVKGRVQCFIVPGSTPMLIGRPILKALKVKMDYETDMISVMGEEWTTALKGTKGEYLIALDDGLTSDTVSGSYLFDYITDDQVANFDQELPLDDLHFYLSETGRQAPSSLKSAVDMSGHEPAYYQPSEDGDFADNTVDNLLPAVYSEVPRKLWKALHHSIRASHNNVNEAIEKAFRALDRPPVFWEVYSGCGNLSAAMAAIGFDVRQFDLPDWNFEKAQDRTLFFDLMDSERPDIIWLAPPCTKWSPLQALNAKDQARMDWLQAERDFHHATHLKFTAKVYRRANNCGQVAVIEHPIASKAWKTQAFSHLPGYATRVDQCALGCGLPDANGVWRPIKKGTRLQVNHDHLHAHLAGYVCLGNHDHLPVIGTSPRIGSRASASGAYQDPMCTTIARHLLDVYSYKYSQEEAAYPVTEGDVIEQDAEPPPVPDPTWQHLRPSTTTVDLDAEDNNLAPHDVDADGTPNTGILKRLHCNRPSDAAKIVARLHRNLGHPSGKDLKKLLTGKGASHIVLKAVDDHQCPTCYRLRPPTQSPKSGLRSTFQFNERLMADTIWLQVQGKPVPVVTIMDAGTRYMAARAIKRENTAEFILALERGWLRTFGPPLVLQVDSHRAWGSDAFRDFATDHDFQVIISPGEAHNRLAQLERRHMVLRTAVEHYMAERRLDDFKSLKEALTYVIPQINSTLSVGGFSPTQWVLGYQPHIPGSLLDSHVNQAHLSPTAAFQQRMQSRALASTAVIRADADQRLRRALLRQHRGDPPPLHVGQRCYYYRESAGVGPRVRWKGPATVVLVEADSSQRPNIYWLVHGSALLRAAPEHVRPDLEASTLAGDSASLHDLVQNVQNRGTTTYTDLIRTTRKRPRPDCEYLTDDEVLEDDSQPLPTSSLSLPLPLAPATAAAALAPTNRISATPPASPLAFEPEPPPSRQASADAPPPGTSSGPADHEMHPALLPAPSEEPDLELPSLNDDDESLEDGDGLANANSPLPNEASLPADADAGLDTPRAPIRSPTAPAHEALPRPTTPSPSEPHTPPAREVQRLFQGPLRLKPETFAERRARLDRQETISFQPAEPGARDRSRSRHHDQGNEAVHQVFSVDILDEPDDISLKLPDGWYVQDGMLHLETIHDWWELASSNRLIRHHVVARDSPFHPGETGDCPVPLNFLTKTRVTVKGNHKHADRWRQPVSHRTDEPLWTGKTIFKIAQTSRQEAESAYYETSSGSTSYAGTREKRAKDAKNLDERTLSVSDRVLFIEAKMRELESFFTNQVWEFSSLDEAPPERVLKAHFILKWSKHPDGSPRAKARLITQGFRDPDALSGKLNSTSPTLSRLGRSCLFSLSTTLQWSMFIADVTTAFLQGREQDESRTLWVKLPADARRLLGVTNPRVAMKLKKSMYGLCDAPRSWYLEAQRRLEAIGFIRHPLDPCLFLYFSNESEASSTTTTSPTRLVAALGMHVDDLLGGGDVEHPEFEPLLRHLKESFSFRDFRYNQAEFEFLGAKVTKLPEGGHRYSHEDYLRKIKPIQIDSTRAADPTLPVTEGERSQLRTVIGALQWAATQTSPHIQTYTSLIAGEISCATVKTLQDANRALRFSKANNDVALEYCPIGKLEDLAITTFSDAAFACRHDNSSQGGYMVALTHKSVLNDGASGRYHVLDWRSFKLPRVARSTLAAESQAAAEATDSHLFASTFLRAMVYPDYTFDQPKAFSWLNAGALIVDAKALYDVLHRDELQATSGSDKRTYLECLTVKDKLRECGSHVRWVSSERQYADGLTKPSAAQLYADRLRTHQLKLIDDDSYQAARRKPLVERRASAYQFARSRSSTTSAAFWTCCFAGCLNTSAAAQDLIITDQLGSAYITEDVNIFASILTFLLILCTLFLVYLRPTPRWTYWRTPLVDCGTQTDSLLPDGQLETLTVGDHTISGSHHRPSDWEGLITDHGEESTQTQVFINHIDGFAQTEHYVGYTRESTQNQNFIDYSDGFVQTEQIIAPHTQEAFTQVRVQLRSFSAQTESSVSASSQPASTQTTSSQDPIYDIFGPALAPSSELSAEENLKRAKRVNVGLAKELQILRARVDAQPWRKARVDDVGDVYLCPAGRVWHYSADCARSKSKNKDDPIVRKPCWYCTNCVVDVPPLPPEFTTSASSRGT